MERKRTGAGIEIRNTEIICPFGSPLREIQAHKPPILTVRFKCRKRSVCTILCEESTGDFQPWDEDLPGREEKRKSSQGDSLFNGLEV